MSEQTADTSVVDGIRDDMESFRLASQREGCVFRLPEPYTTAYFAWPHPGSTVEFCLDTQTDDERLSHSLRLRLSNVFRFEVTSHLPVDSPPLTNNTPWARALRSPLLSSRWPPVPPVGLDDPPFEMAWALAYATFTLWPDLELFRLDTYGFRDGDLIRTLIKNGLAVHHPPPSAPPGQPIPTSECNSRILVVHRAAFWQGAGSPFGPRPVWLRSDMQLPGSRPFNSVPPDDTQVTASNRFNTFPPDPLNYTLTTNFPNTRVHTRHPTRPPKPTPGAMIYSRYIPHLDEMFSMIALDWTNNEHLGYFNTWQNTPRVAEGWNETGTLDEHREYLRRLHNDPHQFAVLGQFDGQPFGYFEIYWAKEDHMGAYYDAQDYDRGRHFLVGEERFRGPHRVKAWHTSLTHYMFLDEPRTNFVVGEPKATGAKVLAYDQANGFYIDKFIDLPHKRAALVKCGRERFFQLVPFHYTGDAK